LSADAEIVVAQRDSALSIPIQSLTVRGKKDIKWFAASDSLTADGGDEDIEGVFVVSKGRALFRMVKIGISGSKYFEVVSGLDVNEDVVSGDYKAIRDLKDGQRVEVKKN
jgi:hypothetical protein